MNKQIYVTLNNGQKMPAFGLGTWKSQTGEVAQAVKDAIDIGYRHVDCASMYRNENEVGEAISAKIEEGVVKREDLFITSKLWGTNFHPDHVEAALRKTLSDLGLAYLDLYLLHNPVALKHGADNFPAVDGKTQFQDVDLLDTWRAVEKLHEAGLVKSIGVSNFNKRQVERVLAEGTIRPVTNQVECHPYLAQKMLGAYLSAEGIVLTAYSPLGCPDRPWAQPGDPDLLQDEQLGTIAKKHTKTPAQVLLRYQLDRGHAVIPKSVNRSRIQENFGIFDFKLSRDEVEYVDGFDRNWRALPYDFIREGKEYPFNDEY